MKNPNLWQVSEVTISYRNKLQPADRPKITSSRDAVDILRTNWSDDIELCETFNVLFINRANQVIGLFTASKGGVDATVVDARLIFSAALKALASGVILSHNHPSGNLTPSQQDIKLTKNLKTAGEVLNITVLDHVIISQYGYYSFADEGAL